ncbi:ATP-dependent DNA helicase PIF1 [Verticillium dahliae VDG1]|nr:ATP-dependent DNA helicase PIF1 [Verticillium dahliae VDG1]
MASKSQSGFRVLVAGGGIAGLTLANCLERAGVEYILLEAHDNVAPRVGASIGLLPNGSRILDQLGCYDKILEETQGVRITRFNYAISYLERETVLRVLYENLQDKSPIQLSRRIMNVDHSGTDGVVVHFQDGTIVAGDVLVGCDGVNSLVRREMWRLSEHGKPQATPVSVRHDLKADFQCLFGLSTRTRGVNAGEMDVNFASGFSTMVIGGKDGRVFWFVFAKMDKTYTSPNIPKYSYQDAVEFANEYMDFTIKDGLKFSDLWQSRTSVTLAATEEAELKEWTWGRIACVGDNVHKMTPHMGAGGNAAMESAATLANELRKLGQAAEKTKIDLETVQMHLETYQRGRRDRTSAVCEASAQLARLQALDSVANKIIAFWILPTAGDLLVDVNCDMIIGAAKLDYIPTPERSVQGTMPFNPSLGLGKGESKLKRGFAGLPLLALSLFGPWLAEPSNLAMIDQLTPLFLSYDHASNSVRAWPYTGVLAASSGLDVMRFHLDFGIICAVVLFESSRRANVLTISSLPIAFFYCLQSFKIVHVMGVYCFAHYVQSPIENFRAKDMRLTNRAYSGTVLVTLLVAYYVPLVTAIMPVFSITTRLTWGYIFQYFPFSISILQNGLKHLFLEDVMDEDKIWAPNGDLFLIGLTIFTFALFAFAARLLALIGTLTSQVLSQSSDMVLMTELGGWAQPIRLFEIHAIFAVLLVWLLYLFSDLKRAEIVRWSWPTLLVCIATALCLFGPGVTVGMGWLDFFTEYHGFEPFLEGTRDDGVISDTVRTKLTQSLGLITGDLVDETNVSMPHIFGDSTTWTSVLFKDAILNLVARLSSRVFLGEELCRNEDWLRIAKSYAVDALTATYLMRMAPSLLRPIAYWLILQCRRSRQAVQSARKLIDPEVKKRKMLVDDALQSGAKPSKISDAIGRMYQVAAGRPVDFVCACNLRLPPFTRPRKLSHKPF